MSEGNEKRENQPDVEPDFTELYKLAVESSKQLTTLNAGSIVIIGTFLKDIFPSQQGTLIVGPFLKVLIALSFVCFGVSLVAASFAMVYLSRQLTKTTVGAWRKRRQQQGGDAPVVLPQVEPQVESEKAPRFSRLFDFLWWASSDAPVVPPEFESERAFRFFILEVFLIRHVTLVPLPFFTTGVLCFGLAVVLNFYR